MQKSTKQKDKRNEERKKNHIYKREPEMEPLVHLWLILPFDKPYRFMCMLRAREQSNSIGP